MRKFSGMKTKIKDRVIRNLAAIAAVAALFFLQGCGKEELYFSVQDAALLGNVYLYQEIAETGQKKAVLMQLDWSRREMESALQFPSVKQAFMIWIFQPPESAAANTILSE